MNNENNIIFIFIFLVAISVFGQKIYLHCGKLIDTKSGKIASEMTIIIFENKIVEVQNGYVASENQSDKIIDLKSKTVMPGLIDMHVHLEMEFGPTIYLDKFKLNDAGVAYNSVKYAKSTLLAGFTTVRDLGGSGVNVSLRNAINAEKLIGPRILTAEK